MTGTWLDIPAPQQAIDPGDSLQLAVLIDPEGILEGVHEATAIIISNDPAAPHLLPVVLFYGESATSTEDPLPSPSPTGLSSYPNPFNPRTILHFSAPRPGPVRVEIFDIRGHLVRRLLDESLPAGGHEIVWDGLDDRGRNVSSGQYFARMTAVQAAPLTRKLMLLR